MVEKDPLQLQKRIADLELENETLAQQVKRLVRAESRLYEFQEELDEQLKEYKDLYQLNKRLATRLDMAAISQLAIDYVIHNLNYERVLFLPITVDHRYEVCAFDGYYDEAERARVVKVALEPRTVESMMSGREFVICTGNSSELIKEYRAIFLLEEFFIYPIGGGSPPPAILVIGNSGERSEFYRQVCDRNGTVHSVGNFVGLISSAVENYIFFHRMQESERRYRQLSEVLEERVQKAVTEIREKDRILIIQGRQAVMGEMISNIAHQWRQPLNILALLAQDLQMMDEMGDLRPDHLERNVNKTLDVIQQMSRTIDAFRNFFKPDKEKVRFKVSDAIDKTLSMVEGTFKAAQIAIEVISEGEPVINGYPSEYSQVLVNVLFNARDAFIRRHVDAPKISIRAFEEKGRTVVSISDNAGGIPEEIIDRIFDPYFTTKGPEQGTGIGLFMCKTIIEKNMNGVLKVQNLKEGAEFRIEV